MCIVGQGCHTSGDVELRRQGLHRGAEAEKFGLGPNLVSQEIRGQKVEVLVQAGIGSEGRA